MTEEDIYVHREVSVLGSVDDVIRYSGREVHSTNEKGILVVSKQDPKDRILYPWHRVNRLVAHGRDEILNF